MTRFYGILAVGMLCVGAVSQSAAASTGEVARFQFKERGIRSYYVELGGGCQGCGMVDVTLKQGIERMLKEQIPEIESVYDTTDHASGNTANASISPIFWASRKC